MTPILVPFSLAALLTADPGQSARAGEQQPPAVVEIDRGDRVEVVTGEEKPIRGRLDRVTADAIVLETPWRASLASTRLTIGARWRF
jgi:hypothetical protein